MTIALLASCLAQAFRPGLTESIRKLGSSLGLDLVVPKAQTCCGLTAWDAGQLGAARAAARRTLHTFASYDSVVTPSPACLRMVQEHIPALLDGQPEAAEAQELAARSTTWLNFLVNYDGIGQLRLTYDGQIALFTPCTDADGDGVRRLLTNVAGVSLVPMTMQWCCGWGNNLAWRHPHVSEAMAGPIITDLVMGRTRLALTTDIGCLLHLEPLLVSAGGPRILHVAEFLALVAEAHLVTEAPTNS